MYISSYIRKNIVVVEMSFPLSTSSATKIQTRYLQKYIFVKFQSFEILKRSCGVFQIDAQQFIVAILQKYVFWPVFTNPCSLWPQFSSALQ